RLYENLGPKGAILGMDADPRALERASAVVAMDPREERPRVYLIESNFRYLADVMDANELAAFDKALFDLGWSSHQLAEQRGFSFQNDEPLLMSYANGGRSAAEIVNGASEAELARIIFEYGEESRARKIARAIVARRTKGRILSTKELVETIESVAPRSGKIHPATKTFQALRIAVNDELGTLEEALSVALRRVAEHGRIAVISFHSLEDRIVKNLFRAAKERGEGSELSKKPTAPSPAEIAKNPRARSAKLRVFGHA
ncbi:MAG: 16S rRNA (cytosine(1402)-N(4))-methyltransferase RsmH, partial [Minisyncoccia bacterium]